MLAQFTWEAEKLSQEPKCPIWPEIYEMLIELVIVDVCRIGHKVSTINAPILQIRKLSF